jgi:hypothetical protein
MKDKPCRKVPSPRGTCIMKKVFGKKELKLYAW